MNGPFGGYYSEALVFLATAGIIVPVFKRFRLSPVHGFLLAGAALGPFGLGSLDGRFPWIAPLTINHLVEVSSIAEFGVVFLMFMIGLELSLERLWHARRAVFGLGAAQVALCMAALAGFAYLFGQSAASAVVIGAALSLSSTAIVLPTLAERKRLHIVSGRTSFAVLLFQDLAVAPLLLMASVLSFTGTDLGSTLVKSLAPGVVAVVALAAIGRLVLRPMFRWVAAARSTELFMAACLLVILGTASVTAAAGQSMALGAFICGLLLAETEFRRQIEALIKPFEGLLLGLFFLSVGAQLDIGLLLGNLPATLGIAAGLIVVKAAAVFGIARVSGLARPVARGAALTLAGGGEFAFVLLSSTSGGVVPEQAASAAIAAVTLSMLAIPLLIGLAERLDARTPDRDEAPPEGASGEGPEAPVIIAGYGRVGTLVGTMLARHGIPFVAIDDDIVLVRRARRQSASNVFFGDATNPELLRRCGVQEARAVVVTMTSREAATAVVIAARAEDAELPIVARAMDPQHAKLLYRHGATEAVPEDIEPSLYLSELVLVEVGVPMGPVIASIHDMREEFRVQLRGKGKNARPRRAIRASSRPADPPAEGDPADGRSVEQVT